MLFDKDSHSLWAEIFSVFGRYWKLNLQWGLPFQLCLTQSVFLGVVAQNEIFSCQKLSITSSLCPFHVQLKCLHLSKFIFSCVPDCDRVGRDRFSPVKRTALLLLLLILSTREVIAGSYIILCIKRSQSSPILQAKRSGVLLKTVWQISCNPGCRTELFGVLVLCCVRWGIHHEASSKALCRLARSCQNGYCFVLRLR